MTNSIIHNQKIIEEMQHSDVNEQLFSIMDFMRWTYSYFNVADIYLGHGYDDTWNEASQLILSGLHLPSDIPESLYHSRLTNLEKQYLSSLIIKRIGSRIPIAYLTQRAWFCGLEFFVDQRVIIPRSPIAELIQDGFTGLLKSEPKQILDMCTGSGCIAIACAARFPNAEIDAIDISQDALDVCEINITRHHMNDRVFPMKSDLFAELPTGQYDLIIANPPYVDLEDIMNMPAEFEHEPKLALAGGDDGLVIVKRILASAADYLADNGVLICEIGNSMVNLMQQITDFPVHWIDFKHGGLGVFAISKEQLVIHSNKFKV